MKVWWVQEHRWVVHVIFNSDSSVYGCKEPTTFPPNYIISCKYCHWPHRTMNPILRISRYSPGCLLYSNPQYIALKVYVISINISIGWEIMCIWEPSNKVIRFILSYLGGFEIKITMSRHNLTRHLQHVLLSLHVQFKIHHMHRTMSRIIHKVDFYIQFWSWMGSRVLLRGEETCSLGT